MTISQTVRRTAVVALLLATSCGPQPQRETASPPASAKVPVMASAAATHRARPSLVAARIDAAEKSRGLAADGSMMAIQERELRSALVKTKDVEIARHNALLVITLRGKVGFDIDSAAINQGLYGVVERIAMILDRYRQRIVARVEGYTDSQGSEPHNLALSQRRAEAVANLMEQLGIDSSRLEAVGFGESRPVADNRDEAGRMANRRVEIKVAPFSP